ncbi:MAG: MXAN_5187 family protein [Myxococcota bacterium]
MLSRFWYFALAALAAVGIAAAFVAQGSLNQLHATRLEEQLVRDRAELELWLRYDARVRVDAIAPMAANAAVRGALRQASARRTEAIEGGLRSRLGNQLVQLNNQLEEGAGQLVFAVDRRGTIVAQLGGGDAPPAGAGIGAFPVVRRALSGYVGDDLWVYNEAVYRIAARPVVDGGQYVGAIVHGMALNATLAQRLASRIPGASLGFFRGERLLASHAPMVEGAPAGPVLEGALAGALADPALAENAAAPADVGEGARGVVSYMTGSAAHARVGYVIARPTTALPSPMALFREAPESAFDGVSWPVVVGLPLLLALLGVLFLFLERDRPLAGWKRAIAALRGGAARIDEGQQRGPFRRIASDLNEVLARAGGGAPTKKADLDQILGGTADESGGGYFSAPGSAPAGADEVPSFASEPLPPKSSLAPGPSRPLPPVPSAAPPVPAALPPVPSAAPPPPPPPDTSFATDSEAGTRPAFDTTSYFDDEEGATTVAQVPDALLEAAKAPATEGDEEQRHFRDVFAQFVAMKKQCGEPTESLTFERFQQTLRRNKQAIVTKHGAASVRFTVYEKNGKAALKATPVK